MFSYFFTQTPLKLFVQSFWRDEAFSYVLAQQNIIQLLVATAKDFNPPLYYIVLKFWMFIFGSSEVALRSISFLFYWGTLYVSYLFLTEILKLDQKKSLLYLLLFILNPLLTYYAFEARMYTMFVFFATLSFYAYFQRKILLYQIVTTLGLYTHYFMILAVMTQLITVYLFERKKPHFSFLIKKMVVPILIGVPWILFVVTQKTFLSESFWILQYSLKDFLLIPSFLYTGYEREFGFLATTKQGEIPVLLWFSLIILGLFFFGYKRIGNRRLFQFLSIWIFFPSIVIFILSLYKPLLLPRYLVFVTPALLFLIILSLESLSRRMRIMTMALLIAFTYSYNQIQLQSRVKTDVAKMMREIKTLAEKDDVIYVTNELDFFTAQYYFGINRVNIYGKTYEELPQYVGKALIPKNKIVTSLPSYPKKAFVLRDETHYDIQSLY
ncbi:glycosyltransferase family 39 protein [Candidatus Roizmanbacteria bacterium]|nr:glycosyltransferase family 39 protein [Candidatus Roizmanbacteria bacterium]